jgi:hypothetical protein
MFTEVDLIVKAPSPNDSRSGIDRPECRAAADCAANSVNSVSPRTPCIVAGAPSDDASPLVRTAYSRYSGATLRREPAVPSKA